MPAVSVNIPVYNRALYIGQTLDSVLAQTFEDWECIVVDDASTDDSVRIVEEYARRDARIHLHRIAPQDKKPFPNSRNVALSHSIGRWVAPLDADDWWEPWKLQRQIDAVKDQPEVVLCCSTGWIWENGRRVGKTNDASVASRELLISCPPVHGGILMDRQVVADLGGYAPDLSASEDWDLWARIILRHGASAVLGLKEPAWYCRRHDANMTVTSLGSLRWERKAARRLLFRHGLLWRHPLLAMKMLDALNMREVHPYVKLGHAGAARCRLAMTVAVNPLKAWRWQFARKQWNAARR